ncbi:hypothetical protein WAI453_005326 [Rhynchosporium graminicola]
MAARYSANMAGTTALGKIVADHFTVGIIGLGDMGKMYARRLSAAGWRLATCTQNGD